MSLWSGRWRPFAVIASLGSLLVYACSSPPRPTWRPALPDRRALPDVHVAPADAGPPPAAIEAGPPPAFPRTVSLAALFEGERVADLSVLAGDDRLLVAWVTYFDGGGPPQARTPARRHVSKKTSPTAEKGPSSNLAANSNLAAKVMVRALDPAGATLGVPSTISVKGESIGGVSLAGGPTSRDDAALAWVGLDAGLGQVFVTRLGKSGEKQTQKMITHAKAGCSDVALLRHKDGYVVAYVEQRDGGASVFAARLGKDLQRIGSERLVAELGGEAYDVRMLARGDEVIIGWGEARQNPELYGILVTRLSAQDLSRKADPVRVSTGSTHKRGLEMAPIGERLVMGWIEEAAASGGVTTRAAFLVQVDMFSSTPPEARSVTLPAEATAMALECDRTCRVVVGGREGEDFSLYGFFYDGAAATSAARLAQVAGISTEDTNPVLVRDWLFFAEDNLHGAGRIRQAKLAWR